MLETNSNSTKLPCVYIMHDYVLLACLIRINNRVPRCVRNDVVAAYSCRLIAPAMKTKKLILQYIHVHFASAFTFGILLPTHAIVVSPTEYVQHGLWSIIVLRTQRRKQW